MRLYGEVAKALPRKRYPEDWAYTQLNLRALHQALADRGGGNEQLDLALKAYQGSARIFTREAAPEQWAGLQMNIGNVYAQTGQSRGRIRTPPPFDRGDGSRAGRLDARGLSGELGACAVRSCDQPALPRRNGEG